MIRKLKKTVARAQRGCRASKKKAILMLFGLKYSKHTRYNGVTLVYV
jgi:hypothetical protein